MGIFGMRFGSLAGATLAVAAWVFVPPVLAQDEGTEEVFVETQELIDSIQQQLDRMAKRAQARDSELNSLAKQIDEASVLLGDRGSENSLLRLKNAELSEEIGVATASQDELEKDLREEVGARDGAITELNAQVAALQVLLAEERSGSARLQEEKDGLTAQNQGAADEQTRLGLELSEARSRIAALTQGRSAEADERSALIAELRTEVSAVKELLASSRQDEVGLQRSYDDLDVQYREALAEKGDFEARLLEVRQSLEQESSATEDRRQVNLVLREEIAALKGELATRDETLHVSNAARSSAESETASLSSALSELRDQLQAINTALNDSEKRVAARDEQVAVLRNQLDTVLAEQFDELAGFRSLLFERLRASLGERPGVRFLGERVVLQSELLFPNASADLTVRGEEPLSTLARTLLSASRDAPIGLEWVLRVDGHTDNRPIGEGDFESNWDLSAFRARSVVQYLALQGVAPDRLAAVGFGEYRPLDDGGDEIAFRRNRRLEFHLVAR